MGKKILNLKDYSKNKSRALDFKKVNDEIESYNLDEYLDELASKLKNSIHNATTRSKSKKNND